MGIADDRLTKQHRQQYNAQVDITRRVRAQRVRFDGVAEYHQAFENRGNGRVASRCHRGVPSFFYHGLSHRSITSTVARLLSSTLLLDMPLPPAPLPPAAAPGGLLNCFFPKRASQTAASAFDSL